MSFGASPDDAALRSAWQQFCSQLQQAGERVFKDENPATPLHRADAFRFLTQNLGQAFDLALETKDTKYPALHAFCAPNRKLGGDAADFVYLQAWIDGESVYKISGNKGTARFLNFTVQGPRPSMQPGTDIPSLHEPFGDIPEANLFGHQLQADADGSFELYIGGPQRGPNWLPTTPGSRKLFLRQGFDRWDELPAQMRIERIDMEEPRPLPTPQTMIAAMNWAGHFVTGLMNDWPDHPYRYGAPVVDPVNVNRFPGTAGVDGADVRRGRSIAHLCWQLAADEALIVEFESHEGFWMVSNNGVFFNSMDYLYRPVSYTPSRSTVDSDGKIRLILSHDDCGYHNWLDTQGFMRGNLTYRCLLSQASTVFRTRLVKRAALAEALPADSVKVSRQERAAQLHARFNSIRWRYSL
ncbi:MAG: hypothetical protein JWQ90_2806 [Hydrocarboniphaga sp.]|uniref:DUF1214 domain-containing protein n=1 Tax=Hydrocarboniphaga sp. TaxID=2033016 RepID=UPI00263572AB|nr:DUF1214 domain-containing protein [Hydrocarboniphaga sp.]MDB5970356.1 hypothetical protein [Hydrocarboniphaga sp.]